jgi:hypothetical protein
MNARDFLNTIEDVELNTDGSLKSMKGSNMHLEPDEKNATDILRKAGIRQIRA